MAPWLVPALHSAAALLFGSIAVGRCCSPLQELQAHDFELAAAQLQRHAAPLQGWHASRRGGGPWRGHDEEERGQAVMGQPHHICCRCTLAAAQHMAAAQHTACTPPHTHTCSHSPPQHTCSSSQDSPASSTSTAAGGEGMPSRRMAARGSACWHLASVKVSCRGGRRPPARGRQAVSPCAGLHTQGQGQRGQPSPAAEHPRQRSRCSSAQSAPCSSAEA